MTIVPGPPNRWEIDSYIDIEVREKEGEALDLPAWMVPLWDGIHAWAANLGTKSMKKHIEATAKRGRIPSQAAAVVLVSTVIERALRRERWRVRQELLEEVRTGLSHRTLEEVLDRICPEP